MTQEAAARIYGDLAGRTQMFTVSTFDKLFDNAEYRAINHDDGYACDCNRKNKHDYKPDACDCNRKNKHDYKPDFKYSCKHDYIY
ncbi:hypothetical protein MRX96_055018 [Rhipicephalus microplus]